ncbi:Rap1a/Tai family immunity protein [Candidatus Methylospira mobilis]|nr:Rap1a/Tai family immunity protein [Candidatus Methylospira mobilis]WNV04093.1 Rap1a/Tai family immunity protein [Candidatus Methylospira mobilis]
MPLITAITMFCLIFLSISGQFALAGSYTGNDFKKDCIQYEHMQKMTGDFSARDAGFCLGYFSAVLENATGFCLPQDARKRDIHKKMAQFLTKATELLDLDASEVILIGLKENFPCHSK